MAKGEPKLKDIAVILLESQEQVVNTVKRLEKLNKSIGDKIYELRNTKQEVDTSIMEILTDTYNLKFENQLVALNKESSRISKTLRNEGKIIQGLYKDQKRVSVPGSILMMMNVLMAAINVVFFIHTYKNQKQEEKSLYGIKKHFEQYLQETDQIADYNEWSVKAQQE